MYKNKERDETIVVEAKEPKVTFLKVVERTFLLLVAILLIGSGLILLVHLYYGPEGVKAFIEVMGIFVTIMVVWGLIMITTAVANRHTQKVVKDVTQSIVDAQYADDRGEVARMIALTHRRNMLDYNTPAQFPHSYPPPAYAQNNMMPYAPNGYPPNSQNDRFDYDGHLNYGDAWIDESSGLK